jgi:hypothetical protein
LARADLNGRPSLPLTALVAGKAPESHDQKGIKIFFRVDASTASWLGSIICKIAADKTLLQFLYFYN